MAVAVAAAAVVVEAPTSVIVSLIPGSCLTRAIGGGGGDGRRSSSPPTPQSNPSDFHSYLCDRIGRARDRVILASLYVGVGSGTYDNEDDGGGGDGTTGCREDELLRALREPTGR